MTLHEQNIREFLSKYLIKKKRNRFKTLHEIYKKSLKLVGGFRLDAKCQNKILNGFSRNRSAEGHVFSLPLILYLLAKHCRI